MNILDEIIKYKHKEVELLKEKYAFINDMQLKKINKYSLIETINSSKIINVITEIKKGSPSKGLFAPKLDITAKAKSYELNGASCISVLTDEEFFYGSFEIMKHVRSTVNLPILCKDFIVDEFQIKLAKYFGANVILLIKRILDVNRFEDLLSCARKHNLEVLVEIENKLEFDEIKHFDFLLCGVNNRDLSDFSINISKTKLLAPLIKSEKKILVSESGIKSKSQVLELRESSVDAILVGESLVTTATPDLLNDLQILKRRTLVKICGISDIQTAMHVENAGADFIGFVFAKSKRKVDIETVKQINKNLKKIKTVGVFQDETPDQILKTFKECNLDYVQIHGSTILKDIKIAKDKIIPASAYYESQAVGYEFVLVDGSVSGSGEVYDLKKLKTNSNQKYFLAGGLNCENVSTRVSITCPNIVDVSSGVESDGIKDFKKITDFIEIVGGL